MTEKEIRFAADQGLIYVDSKTEKPITMVNNEPQGGKPVENIQLTVQDIIEHVKTEICFNYCKMPDVALKKANGDEGVADKYMEEICDKCPLGLL